MRQCLLYFVPRDSMLFPYFLFNEELTMSLLSHKLFIC